MYSGSQLDINLTLSTVAAEPVTTSRVDTLSINVDYSLIMRALVEPVQPGFVELHPWRSQDC